MTATFTAWRQNSNNYIAYCAYAMCDDEDHYMMKMCYPYFVCATLTCSSSSRSRGPINDTGTGAYGPFPAAELSTKSNNRLTFEVADSEALGKFGRKSKSFWGRSSLPPCLHNSCSIGISSSTRPRDASNFSVSKCPRCSEDQGWSS
jgi:hypothetical protein